MNTLYKPKTPTVSDSDDLNELYQHYVMSVTGLSTEGYLGKGANGLRSMLMAGGSMLTGLVWSNKQAVPPGIASDTARKVLKYRVKVAKRVKSTPIIGELVSGTYPVSEGLKSDLVSYGNELVRVTEGIQGRILGDISNVDSYVSSVINNVDTRNSFKQVESVTKETVKALDEFDGMLADHFQAGSVRDTLHTSVLLRNSKDIDKVFKVVGDLEYLVPTDILDKVTNATQTLSDRLVALGDMVDRGEVADLTSATSKGLSAQVYILAKEVEIFATLMNLSNQYVLTAKAMSEDVLGH